MRKIDHTLTTIIYVFIGGGLGALLRYAFSVGLNDRVISVYLQSIPMGTLIANLLGCLTLGLISGIMPIHSSLKIGLTTGLMGGLTTFSTFSAESARLITEGQMTKALLHLLLHTVGGITLAIVGLSLGLNYAKK